MSMTALMVLEGFAQSTVNRLGLQSMSITLIKNVKIVDLHMEHGNVNVVI